jgi:hypothetical protein
MSGCGGGKRTPERLPFLPRQGETFETIAEQRAAAA